MKGRGWILREKLVEKSSDKFDLLRDYEESGVVVDNGESRMEGEKKKERETIDPFPSFLSTVKPRLDASLFLSLHICIRIYPLRYFSIQFWSTIDTAQENPISAYSTAF